MDPYTTKFRAEVLAACDADEGTQAVALRFDVSESWVRRIKQQRRETGQVAPKKSAPRKRQWHAWTDWLLAKIAARPDMYLRELQAELKSERGIDVCLTTICNACRELKQSRKKRRSSPANRIVRTWPRSVDNGAIRKRRSIQKKSCSSTKRGPRPT